MPLACTPTGDQACNPDLGPDWESNPQTFTLQDDVQPTKPHRLGLLLIFTDFPKLSTFSSKHVPKLPFLEIEVILSQEGKESCSVTTQRMD